MSFYSLIISKFSYELLYLKTKYTRNKTKSINDKDAEAYPITKVYIHFKYILFWSIMKQLYIIYLKIGI